MTRRLALLVGAAMALDLVTYLLVPQPIRSTAESNILATEGLPAVLVLKVAAGVAIIALITRVRHHRWLPAAIAIGLTLIGAASNLRGLA